MLDALDELGGGFVFEVSCVLGWFCACVWRSLTTTPPHDVMQLFSHVTHLMGYKVVLLGLYNGQGLGVEYEHAICNVVATQDGLEQATAATVPAPSAATPATTAAAVVRPIAAAPSSSAGSGGGGGDDAGGDGDGFQLVASSKATASTLAASAATPRVQVQVRVTPGVEYVKLVLVDGRVRGAMLIGDTGLEEVAENLILNRLNVGGLGLDLLDPDIDIEDYFD